MTEQDKPRCETCRWGDEVPAWRKQARNALPGKVIVCCFAPIAVLKLPTHRCASFDRKGVFHG